MKKILALSVAVLALVIVTPNLMALTVTTVGNGGQAGNGYGPYQTGSGGEFTLLASADLASQLGNYVNLTGAHPTAANPATAGIVRAGTFQTFCVEEAEYIYPNTQFTVTIGQETLFGYKNLTQGAAWLYEEFATGQLTGYDYTRNNRTSVQNLQNAIWYFMGQIGNPGAGDPYIALGTANGGLSLNDLGNGQLKYNVAVINLWEPQNPTVGYQDQLVMLKPSGRTVPDGGMTVSLLGLVLGGLGLVARKIRK